MNNIYKFLLKYICRKIVVQGYDHKNNIIEYYRIMDKAIENEFVEDGRLRLMSFKLECFNAVNQFTKNE